MDELEKETRVESMTDEGPICGRGGTSRELSEDKRKKRQDARRRVPVSTVYCLNPPEKARTGERGVEEMEGDFLSRRDRLTQKEGLNRKEKQTSSTSRRTFRLVRDSMKILT